MSFPACIILNSRINVHHSRRVLPKEREDLERLAQYIIRNPFSVEKMQVNQPDGNVIYRSAMNERLHRNFEVFGPCDFILLRSSSYGEQVAAITPCPPKQAKREGGSTSPTKAFSLCATTGGILTRCADKGRIAPPLKPSLPLAELLKSLTYPNTSRAAFLQPNDANSLKKCGKPIRSSVRGVPGKCGSSCSLTTGRLSNAFYATLACGLPSEALAQEGNRVCAPRRRGHRPRLWTGSLSPGWMPPSLITTPNR